jgi:hypothetical protein
MKDARQALESQRASLELLIFVDGTFDVAFLQGISHVLRAEIPEVPDLAVLGAERRLAMVALNGRLTCDATNAFASLGLPEFHLYARKSRNGAERRAAIVEKLQTRPNCKAFLTWKRSLENYLHPLVVRTVNGDGIGIDDDIDVPLELACQFYANDDKARWRATSEIKRRHRISDARKWLCTKAVREMNLGLLQDRDPFCEVLDWLVQINEMLRLPSGPAPLPRMNGTPRLMLNKGRAARRKAPSIRN